MCLCLKLVKLAEYILITNKAKPVFFRKARLLIPTPQCIVRRNQTSVGSFVVLISPKYLSGSAVERDSD